MNHSPQHSPRPQPQPVIQRLVAFWWFAKYIKKQVKHVSISCFSYEYFRKGFPSYIMFLSNFLQMLPFLKFWILSLVKHAQPLNRTNEMRKEAGFAKKRFVRSQSRCQLKVRRCFSSLPTNILVQGCLGVISFKLFTNASVFKILNLVIGEACSTIESPAVLFNLADKYPFLSASILFDRYPCP